MKYCKHEKVYLIHKNVQTLGNWSETLEVRYKRNEGYH